MTKEQIIQKIASEHLAIETLETRRSDSLDFHTVLASNVGEALAAAYDAGSASLRTAAEALLAARENGMETQVEWDALRHAVRKARRG